MAHQHAAMREHGSVNSATIEQEMPRDLPQNLHFHMLIKSWSRLYPPTPTELSETPASVSYG